MMGSWLMPALLADASPAERGLQPSAIAGGWHLVHFIRRGTTGEPRMCSAPIRKGSYATRLMAG
jgi:hypothetical protein